jgi:hypothetical protein
MRVVVRPPVPLQDVKSYRVGSLIFRCHWIRLKATTSRRHWLVLQVLDWPLAEKLSVLQRFYVDRVLSRLLCKPSFPALATRLVACSKSVLVTFGLAKHRQPRALHFLAVPCQILFGLPHGQNSDSPPGLLTKLQRTSRSRFLALI